METMNGVPALWREYSPWVGGLTNLGKRKSVIVEDTMQGIYAAGVHPNERERVTYTRWEYELPRVPYGNISNAIVWMLKRAGCVDCVLRYKAIATLAHTGAPTVNTAIPKLAKSGFKVVIERPVGKQIQLGESYFFSDYVSNFGPGTVWVQLGEQMVAHLVASGLVQPPPRYIKCQ